MDERLKNPVGKLRNESLACSKTLVGAVTEGIVAEEALEVRAERTDERFKPLNCRTRALARTFSRILRVVRSK